MNRLAILSLLCLSGCSASGTTEIDQAIGQIILQKAADIHNLEVGLAQIQATPGMIIMIPTLSQVTGTVTTTTPAPVPPNPVPTPSPTPTPTPPSPIPPPPPVPVVSIAPRH